MVEYIPLYLNLFVVLYVHRVFDFFSINNIQQSNLKIWSGGHVVTIVVTVLCSPFVTQSNHYTLSGYLYLPMFVIVYNAGQSTLLLDHTAYD